MDEKTAILFHYSGIIVGEIIAAFVLAIIMFAMIAYRERRKSTQYLFIAFLMEFLFLIGDAISFYNLSISAIPIPLAYVTYFVSYTFGVLTLIPFSLYSKAFIEEKTSVRKWVFIVPVAIAIVDFTITAIAILSGSVYGIVDGKMAETGGAPMIVSILQLSAIIYLPIVALTKKKHIGLKAAMLLGLFGIIPAVLIFIGYDYTGIGASMALAIVYILLQCDYSLEREKRKVELEGLNQQLSDANEEKLAQIEEISALNVQLEENQTRLEESVAEQEAQLEEIASLNNELEERQAQLEELSAEQEAQLEELSALNTELESNRLELERQVAVIGATSQRFFCAYTFNLKNNTYHEVFAPSNMHEMLGSDGDAIKPLELGWKYLVVPEDQEIMKNFHDISKWGEYLRDKNFYSVEYRGVSSGWSKATIYAAKREEGVLVGAVYTLEKIHEQKKAELALSERVEEITTLNTELEERQAQLEELTSEQEAQIEEIQKLNSQLVEVDAIRQEKLNVTNSLSKSYNCIYYIDMRTGTFKEQSPANIHNVSQVVGIGGDAREKFYQMSKHLVKPEFEKETIEFTNLDTLNERMKDKDVLSFQFIGVSTLWFEGNFIASSRDEIGNLTHVLWTIRSIHEEKMKDVTYHRELENANEKLRMAKVEADSANNAKTTFLFNMSHDIRTPMNAIIGFRELLEKHQEEPEKRQDYLKKIEESSSVLLSIINNVLEMARIEKGTIEIDETAWSAEQFNDTLYSIFHEMMTTKEISFTRQIDVKHPFVYCDTIKLREIFINILSNAYKYTEKGGSVNMHLEEVPSQIEGYAMYRTTITDTGVGMSEEFLPHIFEEFSRENTSTENKIEGTGLGMPIVKRLVSFMNGTIEVRSKKGVGTTFIVTIPHRIAEKTNLVEHMDVTIDPKMFKDKRILLAEDNDLNAEIAEEILTEVGFIIERAEDGAICCEKLFRAADNYYDLILMDIQMPNMNGYEATRTIRRMDNDIKASIPILAMTANAFEEDRREALRSGMNGHLSKPIVVAELMKALRGILTRGDK